MIYMVYMFYNISQIKCHVFLGDFWGIRRAFLTYQSFFGYQSFFVGPNSRGIAIARLRWIFNTTSTSRLESWRQAEASVPFADLLDISFFTIHKGGCSIASNIQQLGLPLCHETWRENHPWLDVFLPCDWPEGNSQELQWGSHPDFCLILNTHIYVYIVISISIYQYLYLYLFVASIVGI